MQDTQRYDFLDWLRVIAIFVLLFYHAGMLFVGWGWHITNAEIIPALRVPMDIAHRLRMPLLFLIAGAGLWFALRRRSVGTVLGERTLRLLVPVIAGMFLIVPPQVYIERIAHGQWHGGYLDFYFNKVLELQAYPTGNFSWHHLWFIVYLFVYVVLLLPLLAWWRRARPELRPGAWIFALGVPLGINEAWLKPLYPETHALWNDWFVFNHYLLLTLYGFLLASTRDVWDWLAARRRPILAAALALALGGWTLLRTGIMVPSTTFDSLYANVFTWGWLLTFLAWGRSALSFRNRLLIWARDASYPIYILHQTVMILIAYFVISTAMSPWAKFGVVVTATLVVSALLYEYVLRRFATLRVLFGIKVHGPADLPEVSRRLAAT